jgi:transcriptional regulator with XRE-family HTH domain
MNMSLKLAITASPYSQIELAGKTGIHESRLSKIVNGHLDPNAAEQAALAKALRKPISELFPAKQEVA